MACRHDPPVLAWAEPLEDETLEWPLLPDVVLLESVLLESVLELLLLEPLLPVVLVDELPALLVADVDCADCVAAWAARPKPVVAATAVTARPAVTAAERRLPCSRDVMDPPRMASNEHCRHPWKVAVSAAGVGCALLLAIRFGGSAAVLGGTARSTAT
jgi:hypothetical protein